MGKKGKKGQKGQKARDKGPTAWNRLAEGDALTLAGIVVVLVLVAAAALTAGNSLAPGDPIAPGLPNATPGTLGVSEGVLATLGVPQSGPGSELNAVVAVLAALAVAGVAVGLLWWNRRRLPVRSDLPGLLHDLGWYVFPLVWTVAGVAAGICTYLAGGNNGFLGLTAAVAIAIPTALASNLVVRRHPRERTPEVVVALFVQALATGLLIDWVLMFFAPSIFDLRVV